jgi:hypothetical protein
MAAQSHQEVDEPSSTPSHDRGDRLVRVWGFVRAGIQAVPLMTGKHEGLHLAAQALVLIGDTTVSFLAGNR